MKSLDLHFTCLRSLFSLIVCWLISSQVISLTPLDLQNLSISDPFHLNQTCNMSNMLRLRGSRSFRPVDQSLRTVQILRPRARILRVVKISFIYTAGSGSNPFKSFFTTATAFFLPFTSTHALGAIPTFHPSRTRQSLKEGSPPLRKLWGGVGFEVPALSRYFELRIA